MKLGPKVRSELLSRVSSNPDILRGRPRLKGTRIAVHMVLEALASQMSIEEVLVAVARTDPSGHPGRAFVWGPSYQL